MVHAPGPRSRGSSLKPVRVPIDDRNAERALAGRRGVFRPLLSPERRRMVSTERIDPALGASARKRRPWTTRAPPHRAVESAIVSRSRRRPRPTATRRGAAPPGSSAAAIPPMTRADAQQLGRRRRLAEQDDGQAHRHDRLGQQDDRGDDRRQARQRDRDQQVAGRLGGDPEQRQPEQARAAAASGRGRRRPRPTTKAHRRHEDRRDRDRTGRPARVAAAPPDDQQVARRSRSPWRCRGSTPSCGAAP